MSDIIKNFFRLWGRMLSYIFPFSLYSYVKIVRHYIFSGYIKKEFNRAGKKFYLQYPSYLTGGKYVTIGDNFICNGRLKIEAHHKHLGAIYTPEVIIGNNVSINNDFHATCINKIIIGNDVLIATKVFITDHYHGKIDEQIVELSPNLRQLYSPGAVIIEDNVWIGENVSIMPNVTIGQNCIIGANTVVTKSFPSNSIIAGVPAKCIKIIVPGQKLHEQGNSAF